MYCGNFEFECECEMKFMKNGKREEIKSYEIYNNNNSIGLD